MTIPFQNIPDTRPGYAFQVPGDVGSMAGGMEEVLKALLIRAKLDENQQQLQLQQDQLAEQQRYHTGLMDSEANRQNFEIQKYLLNLQQDQQVGQALGQFATPQDATAPIPAIGGTLAGRQMPVGQSFEQIVANAPAGVRAEVAEKGKPLEEIRVKKAAEKKKDVAQQDWLKTLPSELQPWGNAAVMAEKGEIPMEVVNQIGTESYAKGLTPEAERGIDRVLAQTMGPEATKLPKLEKLELYKRVQQERLQLIFRPPEQGQRLRQVPTTYKNVITSNEMAVNKIDQLLTDLGYDPETGQDMSQQYAGSTAGERIKNLRGAFGTKNILGARTAKAYLASNPEASKVLDAVNQQRSILIYRQAGKVITPNESKLLGWVVNTDMDVKTVVNRLLAQKAFAIEETDITRGLHPEDTYEPLPSFRRSPTPIRPSQIPGAPVFKP